jgi:RimJ/RimL family protein N-acetyltransferase
MKLETENLILREITESDWENIYVMQSEEEYVKFFPWDIRSEDYIKKLIVKFIKWQKESPRSQYQFLVELKEGSQFIGTGGIHHADSKNRSAETGLRLASKFWGKGYASEASKAMLEFGFNDLNLHRITAEIIADNIPAAERLNQLGMKYEGRFREHKIRDNKWYDSLRFAILDHEWRKIKDEN